MPPPSDELSEIDGESCETTSDEAHETEPQLPAPAALLTVINIEAPPRQRANGRLAQVMFLMGLGSVVGLAVHAVQPHLASALHDLGACLAVFTATR